MTLAISRRYGRPSWIRPLGHEGFGDLFFDRFWPEWGRYDDEWIPSMNFYEKDGKYYLTADLPGLKKDDITLSFENGCLNISGKREFEKEKEGAEYFVKETKFGSFCRSFSLPGNVDTDKVDASYKDGVLTLVMPVKKGAEHHKIKIH